MSAFRKMWQRTHTPTQAPSKLDGLLSQHAESPASETATSAAVQEWLEKVRDAVNAVNTAALREKLSMIATVALAVDCGREIVEHAKGLSAAERMALTEVFSMIDVWDRRTGKLLPHAVRLAESFSR